MLNPFSLGHFSAAPPVPRNSDCGMNLYVEEPESSPSQKVPLTDTFWITKSP